MSTWTTISRARTWGILKSAQIVQHRNLGGVVEGQVVIGQWRMLGRMSSNLFTLLADNLRTHLERKSKPDYDEEDARRVIRFVQDKPVKIRITQRRHTSDEYSVWHAEILEVMA